MERENRHQQVGPWPLYMNSGRDLKRSDLQCPGLKMQTSNHTGRTKYKLGSTGGKKHTASDPGADTKAHSYTSVFNVKSKRGQGRAEGTTDSGQGINQYKGPSAKPSRAVRVHRVFFF